MNGSASVTRISRPAEDVFAVIADIAPAPIKPPGLSEVRRTSQGPPSGRHQARLCRGVPRAPLHVAGQALEPMFA
jgi:hypothetical protein